MTITEALLGEHGVFYAAFDHLEQAVPAASSLSVVHAQAALLTASLKTHAHLEDDLLFTTLEPHLGREGGPVAVMRMEHDEIERTLARLPETQAQAEAQQLLLHAIRVARDHFAKEEQILFPLAGEILSEDDLAALGRQWAEHRGVSIAIG